MRGTIVVGVDGSTQGEDALALAFMLADPLDADIVLAHVSPYSLESLTLYERAGHRGLTKLLETAYGKVPGHLRSRARTQLVGLSTPARGLHDLALAQRATLIVVGSSHRGRVGRALAGTVGQKLLNGAPCPVAVAPIGMRERESAVEVVGVGYDGEPEAETALNAAVDLSRALGARLMVVCAAHEPEPAFVGYGVATPEVPAHPTAVERAQQTVDRALERLPEDVQATAHVIEGGTASLAEVAGVDLMVIGSRGYGALRQVLLGSVGAKLVGSAVYPVLILPRAAGSAAWAAAVESAEAAR